MIDLATLNSCAEFTAEHAKLAASSSDGIRALLKRFAQIAKPGEGCPKILTAIARLVGQEWVEGDLRIELSGDETSTTLVVMCDYGPGIRERLLPTTRFAVPLDEFERALELSPKLVLPLRITDEPGKLVLTPLLTPETRVDTLPPSAITVDSKSFGDGERATMPPPPGELIVLDEAMPEEPAPPPFAGKMTPLVVMAVVDENLDDGWGEAAVPVPPGSKPNVHTRPTVRRMVAVDAAAIAALRRRDPRRDDE